MDPLTYLESLIEGMKSSTIPIQQSELELLRTFILMERAAVQKK